ncbi:MAG: PqiC family protein, partial [Plesiomonas sp.]
MVVTQQNLWVDNLQAQLTRTLAATLTSQLPQWQVASNTTSTTPWQLNVQVDRFQGRYDGSVLISGRWTLIHNDQRWQQSFVQTLPQQKNGYADMVRVMSAGWQAQAVDIAKHIQKLSTTTLKKAAPAFQTH